MKKILFVLICSFWSPSIYAQKDTVKYGCNLSYMSLDNLQNSYLFPNFIVSYRKHSIFIGPAFDYYPLFDVDLKNRYALQAGYQYLFFLKNKLSLSVETDIFYLKGKYRFYTSPSTWGGGDPKKIGQYGQGEFQRIGLYPGINLNWNFKSKFSLNYSNNFGIKRNKIHMVYDNPTLEDDISSIWRLNFLLKLGLSYHF